jgi:lysophospholipase L1-like esterase
MPLKPWVGVALGLTPALLATLPLGCSDGGSAQTDASGLGGGGASADAGAAGGGGGAEVGGGSGGARGNPDAADAPLAGVVAAGVRWFGRVDSADPGRPRFSWSGTGFVARFSGTSLTAQLDNGGTFIFKAVIDGAPQPAFTSRAGAASYPLATGLAAGTHTVELYRQTEGPQGMSQLLGITVGDGALLDPPPGPDRLIEVVGDSISCGYGILGTVADADCYPTESHWEAYPSVMARALGAEVSTIAASGRGVIRNYAGDTADTMPMIYGRALANSVTPAWDFRNHPQAVVINLGTNDISNGKGNPGVAFQDSYLSLVETIRAHYPRAYILCVIAPLLSVGEVRVIEGYIRNVVAARAAVGDTQIELFDQIAPQTSDKFACASHPNVAENALMANLLADRLRAQLGW